jgi:hypothetical protein
MAGSKATQVRQLGWPPLADPPIWLDAITSK